MRPSEDELYGALTELQSSAAAYVRELEDENRALREALTEILIRAGPGDNSLALDECATMARVALKVKEWEE